MNILRSVIGRVGLQTARASLRVSSGLLSALAVTVCTACGGKASDTPAGASVAKTAESKDCAPQPGKPADFVAVADYIKTTVPKPMRFLSAAGTDSSVSEDGFLAMQDKGPSYYYAGTDAQKKLVRDKLELAGPYTALLIVMHGNAKNSDGTRTVHLGGHFLTGEFDGKLAESRIYTMSCGATGWVVAGKTTAGAS